MSKATKSIAIVADQVLHDQISRLNSGANEGHWKIVTTSKGDGSTQKHLEANYKLKTFAKTWNFLNIVAYKADITKHHPTINTTYNEVNFKLTTHDVGNQITYKDLKLAQFIENEYKTNVDIPQKIVKMDRLINDARKQVSLSQASVIINELVSLKNAKENTESVKSSLEQPAAGEKKDLKLNEVLDVKKDGNVQ